MLALGQFRAAGKIREGLLHDYLAAVSVGIVGIEPRLDLDYPEDSNAEVDMNVVMTGRGFFVEVQGTAEKNAFSRKQNDELLDLAQKGIEELISEQKQVLSASVDNLDGLFRQLMGVKVASPGRD